jgi:glutathione synthase
MPDPHSPTSERLRMAFVMDPIESIDIAADTTFAFMLEAQRRGHEIFYVAPGNLGVAEGRASALAVPVRLRRETGNHVDLGDPRQVALDDEIDVAFQRVDPPVDADYTLATQILGICSKTLVLNRPQGILAHNEKLFALHFYELMTDTMVSPDIAVLREFMKSVGGEMIIKPLEGKGGEGIFHLVEGERNISSILEQSTNFGQRSIMAQRYLPEVRNGDKRILLLDGEFLGAVLRVPTGSEVRANFHTGGRAAKAELNATEEKMIERLGPTLRREGLFFVGIDVIGNRLTEINVTSPTGIQEINALDGVCLETRVIERVEALAASGWPILER